MILLTVCFLCCKLPNSQKIYGKLQPRVSWKNRHAISIYNRYKEAYRDFEIYYSNNLVSFFPNLGISLRIFLTIPVSVASGERSFSKLKIIKTYLRSTISQERLTNLGIISIENEICENLDHNQLIDEYASTKARNIFLK